MQPTRDSNNNQASNQTFESHTQGSQSGSIIETNTQENINPSKQEVDSPNENMSSFFEAMAFSAVNSDNYQLLEVLLGPEVKSEKEESIRVSIASDNNLRERQAFEHEKIVFTKYLNVYQKIKTTPPPEKGPNLREFLQNQLDQAYSEAITEAIKSFKDNIDARDSYIKDNERIALTPEIREQLSNELFKRFQTSKEHFNNRISNIFAIDETIEQLKQFIKLANQAYDTLYQDNVKPSMEYEQLRLRFEKRQQYQAELVEHLIQGYKALLPSFYHKKSPEFIRPHLLQANLNVNITDTDGNTLLHHAAKKKHLKSAKVLLEREINQDTLNNNQQNFADYAGFNNSDLFVKSIKEIAKKHSQFLENIKKELDNYEQLQQKRLGNLFLKFLYEKYEQDRGKELKEYKKQYKITHDQELSDESFVVFAKQTLQAHKRGHLGMSKLHQGVKREIEKYEKDFNYGRRSSGLGFFMSPVLAQIMDENNKLAEEVTGLKSKLNKVEKEKKIIMQEKLEEQARRMEAENEVRLKNNQIERYQQELEDSKKERTKLREIQEQAAEKQKKTEDELSQTNIKLEELTQLVQTLLSKNNNNNNNDSLTSSPPSPTRGN